MASVLEPEVQFAQKLASNEKPVRNKAVKKLRKYISARSQRETGGFSGDELLKLWKGLFYCVWMQDKPLLQEELSNQISGLILHFHTFEGQLLYLDSFLLTVKREWTGIDRLRMDKFFQLVRFMFRQTFEMLRRRGWDSSCVGGFLKLLSSQLLHNAAVPPVGLQLHVLDLYLRELASVGAHELTADQNLVFIEPFCKTAAKTKDRSLFRAICNSIFSLIIDQAPFAIEELMKEVEVDSDHDSGQASDEQEEQEVQQRTQKKGPKKTKTTKQMNGKKSGSEDRGGDEDDDEDDDDDELVDSESEPCDEEEVGPILQFDYGALADKLLELSSRGNTPSRNRQRLYKIIKVLRDLSEGTFPQDEYPEEVSTDEDDDDFGSRKRMKRTNKDEEDDEPASKKSKGKKEMLKKRSTETTKNVNGEEVKKKKRKKKKKKVPQSQNETLATGLPETTDSKAALTEETPELLQEPLETTQKTKNTSALKEVNSSGTSERKRADEEQALKKEKQSENKNKGSQTVQEKSTQLETYELKSLTPCVETDHSLETCPLSGAKINVEPDLNEETGFENNIEERNREYNQAETEHVAHLPKKKKSKKAFVETDKSSETRQLSESKSTAQEQSLNKEEQSEHKVKEGIDEEHHKESEKATQLEQKKKEKRKTFEDVVDRAVEKDPKNQVKTRSKQIKGMKTDGAPEEETPVEASKQRKKTKKKNVSKSGPEEEAELEQAPAKKKKKRKIPVEFEYEADEIQAAAAAAAADGVDTAKIQMDTEAEIPQMPLSTKIQKKKKAESAFISFHNNASPPPALFCRTKGQSKPLSGKTKCVTPKSDSKKVTFGLKNNKTAEFRKTDRSLLVSPDGSSRVAFDPEQKPKCGVLKSPFSPLRKVKKTPPNRSKRKMSTPLRARPTAADFF